MKLILFFVISCIALHNGKGAPTTAVYKFVRCNPDGDQANCVTQQSPEMAWSPDLPAKLPASTAQYLEAEPVEDDSPLSEEEYVEDEQDEEEEEELEELEEEEEEEEEESPMASEDGESPVVPEEGSGLYEGSAAEDSFKTDLSSMAEMGSGESWTEKDTKPFIGKPAEQEMKEDHLLQL